MADKGRDRSKHPCRQPSLCCGALRARSRKWDAYFCSACCAWLEDPCACGVSGGEVKRYRIIDNHPYRRERCESEWSALNPVDAVVRYTRAYGLKGHFRFLVSPVEEGPVVTVEMHCSPQRRRGRW